jgi:hypothetical protein
LPVLLHVADRRWAGRGLPAGELETRRAVDGRCRPALRELTARRARVAADRMGGVDGIAAPGLCSPHPGCARRTRVVLAAPRAGRGCGRAEHGCHGRTGATNEPRARQTNHGRHGRNAAVEDRTRVPRTKRGCDRAKSRSKR